MPTPIVIKYVHVRRFTYDLGSGPVDVEVPVLKTAYPFIFDLILAEIDPTSKGLGTEIWKKWNESKSAQLPQAWAVQTTVEQFLFFAAEAKEKGIVGWDIDAEGLLGAPKSTIESTFGEERLGKWELGDLAMYMGFDSFKRVLWVAWKRNNGHTFDDDSSLAQMSVARRGGLWVSSKRNGNSDIGAGSEDITFTHYNSAEDNRVPDGYLGAQGRGRHGVIAYKISYPFDKSAVYSWM